ncbi:hypothetical protein RJ641_028541 [Dillenia turbinata]|uniref:Uncharacterized protein n=1 Tax=Dillenia turbinata TaxID=194707 RepID=A0AAN8VZE2_9MAGN
MSSMVSTEFEGEMRNGCLFVVRCFECNIHWLAHESTKAFTIIVLPFSNVTNSLTISRLEGFGEDANPIMSIQLLLVLGSDVSGGMLKASPYTGLLFVIVLSI